MTTRGFALAVVGIFELVDGLRRPVHTTGNQAIPSSLGPPTGRSSGKYRFLPVQILNTLPDTAANGFGTKVERALDERQLPTVRFRWGFHRGCRGAPVNCVRMRAEEDELCELRELVCPSRTE